MILSFRQFPDRTEIPNTPSGSITVEQGAPTTLDAPAQIVVLNPGKPDTKYDFLFWHTNRILVGTETVTFTAPVDDSSFFATAWYVVEGPGNGGKPVVTTIAFSTDTDEVIAGTPIASVTPSGAWGGPPSTIVSTTTSTDPVVITAKVLIDGFGEFESWLTFRGNVSGGTLTVPAQESTLAIASYGIPQPDPCAGLRATRDGLNPGDFPSQAAFQRALAAANRLLHNCERQHGEPLD